VLEAGISNQSIKTTKAPKGLLFAVNRSA